MRQWFLPLVLLAIVCCLSGCLSPDTSFFSEPMFYTPSATVAPSAATPSPTATAEGITSASSDTPAPTDSEGTSYPPSNYTREESLELLEDKNAPDFTLETLDGIEVSLSDYRGKIVFISFWQTWCPPCVSEMPLFEQLMKDNDDVVVLAVNALPGEGKSEAAAERDVRAFIGDHGFTFPVLLDRDGGVFSNPAYNSQYIPANYVIDREGILRVSVQGAYNEESMAIILDVLRGLDW